MLNITTNLSSLITQRSLNNSTKLLSQAIERMTTGYKLNHASDNAANYSISTNLTTKLGAYQVAEDNAAMGLDMLTTANESLNLISDHLVRIRALAEQAANGTYGAQSLKAINSEVNARVDEIERLYNTTEYNGIKLFNSDNEELEIDPNSVQAASIAGAFVAGNTYTVNNAKDLQALADMANSGISTSGVNFVMTDNIDMSGVANYTGIAYFQGVFDGNGYVIENLSINKSYADISFPKGVGLFRELAMSAEVKNLGLENCEVKGNNFVGGLAGWAGYYSKITNCYVKGDIQNNGSYNINDSISTGGLVGALWFGAQIDNCYSECNVNGGESAYTGGLIGCIDNAPTIVSNSSTTSIVSSTSGKCGAFAGGIWANSTVSDCKYYSSLNPGMAALGYNISSNINNLVDGINPPVSKSARNIKAVSKPAVDKGLQNVVDFQVGIMSDISSRVSVDLSFSLLNIEKFKNIGLDNAIDYLSQIDELNSTISAKQVEYGAAQNRLESALDEISTHYENLLSSRSTLKDADIARVSSQYIQQQILQQASATLMSTANQTPALALQLL